MFISPGNGGSDKLLEEFRPVESIMRCEDFKSNFARRLSTRYSSSSSAASPKQEVALTLCPPEKKPTEHTHISDHVAERTNSCSLLPNNNQVEKISEVQVSPGKDKTSTKRSDFRNTEMTALHMEVETLRWQLAQTEANRQMHISLLKQLVTFLSRVKEHIELQSSDHGLKRETSSSRSTGSSFNKVDLPRSRSVVHVNKNAEYSVTPPKKMSTRKISKSISNVHGYSPTLRSVSKLSLAPNNEKAQKIIEEISRMTKFASTILSTKLPDLASMCIDNHNNESNMTNQLNIQNETEACNNSTSSFDIDVSCDIFNNAVMESEMKEKSLTNLIEQPSVLSLDLKNVNESAEIECDQTSLSSKGFPSTSTHRIQKIAPDKMNDYGVCNFIEDESGFSSMNSFQDIGIPIISIIPPSPCKEISYSPLIMNDSEKLLDKQAVKVFWV